MPFQFDEDEQHYQIPGPTFLRPTNFTTDEALALIVLCDELGDRNGLPFYGPARSAALKIESTLPANLRDHLRKFSSAIEIQLPSSNPLEEVESTYQQLLQAIGARRSVRVRYDSFTDDEKIVTRLNPYRLLFSHRSWYVIGRSSIHRSVRTFNVGRILKLEPLDVTYAIPKRFSVQRHLRNAWRLIPERGPDQNVVVRFQPMVARNVAEVMWHKSQRLHFNRDGTLDYHVTVSGLNEISWWILGYGDQAEVLKPPGLRKLITDRCRRLLEAYGAEVTSAVASAAAKTPAGKPSRSKRSAGKSQPTTRRPSRDVQPKARKKA